MFNSIDALQTNHLNTIQGLWIGKLGMLERLSMKSFLAHGHSYHLYAYEPQDDLPEGVVLKNAADIIPQKDIFRYQRGKARGGYSGFANLFRYELLRQKGGWWCDTDIICLKPFDFKDEIVLASEKHWLWPNKICNAVMRCPAGHPFIEGCVNDALQHNPKTMKFAANGEPVVTRNVRKFGLLQNVQPPEVFNPINWFNSASVTQDAVQHHIPASSYAIHCYRETWRWRLKNQQANDFRNRIFPADTLLGSLQHKYFAEELGA